MLPDPELVRDDDNDDDDMMMTLTRWGMTFESLVLLTMAEEHLANSRHDSGDNWKPIKVHVIKAIVCPLSLVYPFITSSIQR